MALPTLTTRVDWYCAPGGTATFTGTVCAVKPLDTPPMQIVRGRSPDLGTDQPGQITFTLDNTDFRYTPDRNWHDNASFEIDTSGWAGTAIASLTAAATSISRTTADYSSGTACGSAVLTATSNSGVHYALPYRFRKGVTYSFSVALKSKSGNLNVRAGLASSGTPADIGSTSSNITTSWVRYAGTWTPSADRTDVVFFVRTTTAATATVLIDAVQVNPGSTLNTYLEAPTRGQLTAGKPIHVKATYSTVDYGVFFGIVERITPNPSDATVAIIATDPMKEMSAIDACVASDPLLQRSPREFRTALLDEYDRGDRNLLGLNPSFETDVTTGWTSSGSATVTRVTTDAAPGGGTACMQIVASGGLADVRTFMATSTVPNVYAGQVYTFSGYLKRTAGSGDITVTYWDGSAAQTTTITPTSSWARYSIAMTMAATIGGTSTWSPLNLIFQVPDGTTLRVDNVAITRGQTLLPYSASGSGRWPNWVAVANFEGTSYSGWYGLNKNYVANPSFEVDTSGWSASADAFHGAAAGGISRGTALAATRYVGNASLVINTSGTAQGTHYAVTGTFYSGVTYQLSIWTYQTSSFVVGVGSQGTPADVAKGTATARGVITVNWTPSANRTDAHVFAYTTSSSAGLDTYIDRVQLVALDGQWMTTPAQSYREVYLDGGGIPPSAVATSSAQAKYGSNSLAVTTRAVADCGVMYDPDLVTSPLMGKDQPYTASVWVRSSGAGAAVKVCLGGFVSYGTAWDFASGSATVGTSWTQITVTWTPAADTESHNKDAPDTTTTADKRILLTVRQTDTTARTLYIDGVRIIPGSSADDFELATWDLATGTESSDRWTTSATLNGTVLTGLQAVNTNAFSRHWIAPGTATPWYTYTTASRDERPAIAETFTNTVADITGLETVFDTLTNSVAVQYATGTVYATNAQGVADRGPIVGSASAQYVADDAAAQDIADAIVARTGTGHLRPTVRLANLFPSILQRAPNDLVAVTVAGWGVPYFVGSIERIELTIDASGQGWTAVYQLDEWPYAV